MGPLAKTRFWAYPGTMHALPLILALALPARAGVASSAEAGADASVPKISLQTSLSPIYTPALGTALTPGLTPTLAAPSVLTAQSLPAPLPVQLISVQPAALTLQTQRPVMTAATTPELPGTAVAKTEAAKTPVAEPGTPTFKAKILGMLKALASPFSKKEVPEELPGDGPVHPLLTGESKSLELDGLTYKGARLQKSGLSAKSLGVGMRGFVDAHPSVPGAVIKTVNMASSANPMIAAEQLTEHAYSEKEETVARELEALGAGPKYFGKTTLDGRLVSVRERIYGKTIEKMMSARTYGHEEHALVLAMLRKLADAGVTATDLKTENIMIGRTAADPTIKAWLVDGGSLAKLPAGTEAGKSLDAVLDSWVPTTSQFGSGTSLRKLTDKGLKRFKGEPPPKNEAERLDREFSKLDFWAEVAPVVRAEIEGLRARKLSKADLAAYVKSEADAAIARIKAARGIANMGFHYNLHGGQREEYVGVGIRATMGDIALRYDMNADRNYKVYFFQSGEHGGYVPLDSKHGEHLFASIRMGFALSLFDLDAPSLKEARADGRIKNFGSISMDFHGLGGVPYETYLAPPVEVFRNTSKKVGMGKLSWDEETLATVRYLEAAVTNGGPYVPGGAAAAAEAKALGKTARELAAAKASPKERIIPQFALVDNSFLYHGTTLDDVARIVAAGGDMAPEVSQFSMRSRDSVGYASERRRRVGGSGNPEVLLQFDGAKLAAYVSGEQFKAALAMTDRGMPPVHAAYVAATKPLPLSLMTQASKTTILSWMRANNDPRLAAFEAVLK